MSRAISYQQLEVINPLKEGAVIHVYRSGLGLRAFMSNTKKGIHVSNVRITTVMSLARKKTIKREKSEYGDDWAGIWTLRK